MGYNMWDGSSFEGIIAYFLSLHIGDKHHEMECEHQALRGHTCQLRSVLRRAPGAELRTN